MLATQKQTTLGDFFAVVLAWVRQTAEEQIDKPNTNRANHLFKTCYTLNTWLLQLPNPSVDVLVMCELLDSITPRCRLEDYQYQQLLAKLDQWAAESAIIMMAGRQLMADVKAFIQPHLAAGLHPKGGRNPKNSRLYLRLKQKIAYYIDELSDEELDREDRGDPEALNFLAFLGQMLSVQKFLEDGTCNSLILTP